MEKQQGPKGFLVVLPGEIIEIPQDSYKSWLTLFYSLPQEFVSKRPAYMSIPRCPYEVLRTDKYTAGSAVAHLPAIRKPCGQPCRHDCGRTEPVSFAYN